MLAGGASPPAAAQDRSLRPQLKAIVDDAQQRYREKDYAGMVPLIAKARSFYFLSGFEEDVIDHLQGLQCRGVGDLECFRKNFTKVIDSGLIEHYQRLDLIQAVAVSYLETNEASQALTWFKRYQADGGYRIETLALIPSVSYLASGPPVPDPGIVAQVDAVEQAGQKPTEAQLRLLGAAQVRASDGPAFVATLEKMTRLYPTREHWSDLIWTIRTRRAFAAKLDLDIYRLLRAKQALQPTDYPQMIDLARASGLQGEAKAVKDEGVANGALASLEKKDKHYDQLWRSGVDGDAERDHAHIAITDAMVARSEAGDGLISTGMAYVTYGETAKGLSMLDQGLARGNLEHPDWALLHDGYAQYWTGNAAKARNLFGQVGGGDGAGDLAQLWMMVLQSP